MKVEILVTGDYESGIPDFITNFDLGFELEGDTDRDEVHSLLSQCFKEIYDKPVCITFEDEMEERECNTIRQYDGI